MFPIISQQFDIGMIVFIIFIYLFVGGFLITFQLDFMLSQKLHFCLYSVICICFKYIDWLLKAV